MICGDRACATLSSGGPGRFDEPRGLDELWDALDWTRDVPLETLRARAALLCDRVHEAGRDSWRPGDRRTVSSRIDRLLDLGLHDVAIELVVAAASQDGRLSDAAEVATELWRIHFADSEAPLRAEDAASRASLPLARNELTIAALQASARLRPHARGGIGTWERELLMGHLR